MSESELPPKETARAEPDLSNRKLGNYQLLRRLGRGGMADVYLAEQLSLRRQVAFKVLRQDLCEDEAYVRRFHNEARAAASLVHANIVQIHEVGRIEGIHFIAQEYVPGQNLKQWLTRHGTADAATAVHVMRQVIAALNRASQQGIVHRDIKPENIMLAKTGEVKVADFGLARVTAEGPAVGLTQVGVTLGTPLYMSPEQVEGRLLDPRSDLYSFGVTCYEMLAGRPPFGGDTPLGVAVQHLRAEATRLEAIRPDLPEGLCRIVHRLLAKSPTDRYTTAADLMRALRAVHVEGLEQWSAASNEWDTPELLALSEARSEVTLRLDAVMKSQARAADRSTRIWRISIAIVVGLLLGVGVAWQLRPPDLLAIHSPTVEMQQSAMEQYWYAYGINTKEAWLAVAQNFPPEDGLDNRVYSLKAKQRLAEWYRDNDRSEQAKELYVELAKLRDEEPQLAAGGLIGQVNLLADAYQLADEKELANEQDIIRRRLNSTLGTALSMIEEFPAEQRPDVLLLLDPKVLPIADNDLRERFEEKLPDRRI